MTGKKQKCRGRPASFDRQKLVGQVMELFWERGYSNLSFNEVAKITGLTRASLYNAFATKEALFLEVVDTYLSHSPTNLLSTIDENEPVAPHLFQYFQELASLLTVDSKQRGCLTVNCMAEAMPTMGVVAEHLRKLQIEQEELYARLIRQAVKHGEIDESVDSEVAGAMIMAFVSGLAIYSKKGVGKKRLIDMAGSFLCNLGFSANSG